MKKFVVYLMVIVMAVSLGFAVFYLVKDDEVISISSASIYTDVNKDFSIDIKHENKKSYTKINITSSNDEVVKYNEEKNSFTALSGGVARVNFRTNNAKFRNLWCDVIVGDGTETSPFYISSAEQLAAIGMGEPAGNGSYKGAEPYTDYTSDKCYKLVADIDVKDVNEGYWIPLRSFSGVFDGNGYVISNINIDHEAYDNHFKNSNTYNATLHSTTNVGLFQTIEKNAKVFNIKISNYRASGRYVNFGTIAGINYGTIERVEVKDAYLSVENKDVANGSIGGLVGQNITTENGGGTTYERYVARIDRCSVNLTLGKKKTFNNNQFVENVIGVTGIIGGLVGINEGGTIVYSYTNGSVTFANDSVESIIYGGLVGKNSYKALTTSGGLYSTNYQGANIKDCYSNIITQLEVALVNADSRIAGAIAENFDFTNSIYSKDPTKEIVQNYIIGVYYNADNLNAIQNNGIAKAFNGIAEFSYNTKVADILGVNLPIVTGLTTAEMKDANKFISHFTSDIAFDENGNSLGVKQKEVYWLFDTVWTINEKENNGMPYLNYQLVYIPNDFTTVGTAVIIAGKYQYINDEVEYPVTIVSGYNKIINIEVGEEYTLKASPAGLTYKWVSNDPNTVEVDSTTGTIKGLKAGSASVTVSTSGGMYSDYIDVYVTDKSYAIVNTPPQIVLNVGGTYSLSNVVVVPTTTINYAIEDTSIATVNSNGLITAISAGDTRVILTAGNTVKYIPIKVFGQTSTVKALEITLVKDVFNYTFDGTPITGRVEVASAMCEGSDVSKYLVFNYSTSNSNIVSIDQSGNFTVLGTGFAQIIVFFMGQAYEGSQQAIFNISAATSQPNPSNPIVQAGLVKTSYNINVGDYISIETYGSISSIKWVSSDTSKVTVDSNGIAKGIAQGTATISAEILKTDGTYVYASCDITVVGAIATPVISLSPLNSSVYTGDKVVLNASLNITDTLVWTVKDSNGNNLSNPNALCSWNIISNTQYEITMLSAGSIMVEVSYNNIKKTAIITSTNRNTYIKEIRTIEQLKNVNNFLDKEFILVTDLDLTGINWTPIGSENKPFTGIFTANKKAFNGESFRISGLNVDSVDGGLFGYTKNATLNNIYVTNSIIKGSSNAGAIVGTAYNTRINSCVSQGNTITAVNAGGLVGKIISGTSLNSSKVVETTVTSITTNSANIGGAVGYVGSNCTINKIDITNTSKYIATASGSNGNVGGIAGYSQGSISNCTVLAKVVANNKDNNYAGGAIGYATGKLSNTIIRSGSSIEGYYAGGIGGALNTGTSLTIKFSVTNKGYRKSDISSIGYYSANVESVAVKNSINICGEEVGGLFGIINSGVVMNCYTRANLTGYAKTSHASGFASEIKSTGFNKDGGTGQVGIIENCYSACTFSGSCLDYAISKSIVHDNINNRTYGYIFNYVFDKDLAKNTDYESGLFMNGDPAGAQKSTSQMKNKTTYTDKGFSSTYWNFSTDYPTLVIE